MSAGNIKVVVRVRPFNSRELNRNAKCIVSMKDTQTVLTPLQDPSKSSKGGAADHGTKTFAFDKSYWSFDKEDSNYAGQEHLFEDLGNPLLDNAFKGYNNCIFAYGQTGSGKSYSMMGYGPEQGVIPKICQDMFRRIDEIQQDKNLGCTVEVSYLEIYNEKVRDLLNPANKGNLKVREHPSTGPYVEDLAKLAVRSFKEIENLMDEGNKARTVAATNMNETSSRSHAVFTLTLTQKRHDVETSMDTEKVAKISLVDLAGSERANSTGATGARLKEGAEINRSLSTLGRCIAALADLSSGKGAKKKGANMVPYRDSVLTWLLKDSLGGNSMTAMIAAISPADINFEETLSTLRYADSAKRIKNHAVINEDPNARMIRELKEELASLRAKLGGGGGLPGGIPQEEYAPGTPLDQQFVSILQEDGSTKKVSKAEIADQLSQSEKLYKDLNQTWEEKLLQTEVIQREREQALEDLGISIEKGFVGMSTPKKMPHLVNLSDDPLLAECLVYNLKPGTTTVGNVDDEDTTCEIRLKGSKILKAHCVFEHANNVVTVIPSEGAAVMVNGLRVDKPTKLGSGNRIILGDFHIFRYNNPQEARQERAERGTSLLRHSVTAGQLSSPSPRPMHDRSISQAGSEIDDESRPESPIPSTTGRDSDWSFARREAASAMLGVDQKINHLTDEELDALFDDVQRARAVRRGRPESRLRSPDDDESESISSGLTRDKYMSNGTMDNFSLDTALTIPNTPQINGEDGQKITDERLQQLRDSMQQQLERQKEEYQEQLRVTESTTDDVEKLQVDKERMEDELRAAKVELQAQLKQQKKEYETELQEMLEAQQKRSGSNSLRLLTNQEKLRAAHVVERWRQLRNIGMAETMLIKAMLLKEAQVMSQLMDKGVMFQFIIVDEGQDVSSSYDLVLNGLADEESDDNLQDTVKPCVAVRVTDYNHCVIHLWSLEKLDRRVQAMKQMHQYHDRPEYMQHFHLENPFIESFLPQYSLIGDAHVPLTAVFERRVQDYSVDVLSPYTHQCIGVIKLSLEPSAAEAPATTLKFNIVMHEMVGFAEREGTDVHAQMFVPGVGSEGMGASTTQIISGFDETPIRFESVHSMSIAEDSPERASLLVAVFAKATPMHLDKLLSWDEVRELAEQPLRTRKKRPRRARLPETEFYSTEQHDVFAKVQILEMSESGEYAPVEVEQSQPARGANPFDAIIYQTYQLHQGLQRRVSVELTHCSSEPLQWEDVESVAVGNVRLVDPYGKFPDLGHHPLPEIGLKFVGHPNVSEDAGGPTHLRATAQWDSSLHDSILLDRPTAEKYAVQVSVTVTARSARTTAPLKFPFTLQLAIRPRTWMRPAQSMFRSLWRAGSGPARTSTTALFAIQLAPAPSKRATDLWRLDSSHAYVKGEEALGLWQARGVSLVRDFVAAARKRRRVTEVEAAKASLARLAPPSPMDSDYDEDEDSDDGEGEGGAEATVGDGAANDGTNGGPNGTHPASVPTGDAASSDSALPSPQPNGAKSPGSGTYTPKEVQLLEKTLALWKLPPPLLPNPPASSLATPPTSPPPSHSAAAKPSTPPRLTPTVLPIPKNPVVLQSGVLLVPRATGDGWERRWAELRPPYLHLHATEAGGGVSGGVGVAAGLVGSGLYGGSTAAPVGEELAVLNLRNATVDPDPAVGRVLEDGGAAGGNVWAAYAVGGSGVFACRSAQAKGEWIWAVDRAFLGPERDEWVGSDGE